MQGETQECVVHSPRSNLHSEPIEGQHLLGMSLHLVVQIEICVMREAE